MTPEIEKSLERPHPKQPAHPSPFGCRCRPDRVPRGPAIHPPPRAAVTPSPDIGRDVLATRDGIRLVHAFAGITDKAARAAIIAAAAAAAKKSGERDGSRDFDPAATDAMR